MAVEAAISEPGTRRRGGPARAEQRSLATKTYDAIIIGTGQAGPFLAQRLAGAGMKVAIIERKLFGGTCVNTGCVPTKTMVASAYATHMVRSRRRFRGS
jgi:pyruvate/2-oxoglutarate dehydrogenase complex dihydrolipoamide dehydrogenase (E3) component